MSNTMQTIPRESTTTIDSRSDENKSSIISPLPSPSDSLATPPARSGQPEPNRPTNQPFEPTCGVQPVGPKPKPVKLYPAENSPISKKLCESPEPSETLTVSSHQEMLPPYVPLACTACPCTEFLWEPGIAREAYMEHTGTPKEELEGPTAVQTDGRSVMHPTLKEVVKIEDVPEKYQRCVCTHRFNSHHRHRLQPFVHPSPTPMVSHTERVYEKKGCEQCPCNKFAWQPSLAHEAWTEKTGRVLEVHDAPATVNPDGRSVSHRTGKEIVKVEELAVKYQQCMCSHPLQVHHHHQHHHPPIVVPSPTETDEKKSTTGTDQSEQMFGP